MNEIPQKEKQKSNEYASAAITVDSQIEANLQTNNYIKVKHLKRPTNGTWYMTNHHGISIGLNKYILHNSRGPGLALVAVVWANSEFHRTSASSSVHRIAV